MNWNLTIHVAGGQYFKNCLSRTDSVGAFVTCTFNDQEQKSEIARVPTCSADPKLEWNHRFLWKFDDQTLKILKRGSVRRVATNIKLRFYTINPWEPNTKNRTSPVEVGYVAINLKDALSNAKKAKYQDNLITMRLRGASMSKGFYPEVFMWYALVLESESSQTSTHSSALTTSRSRRTTQGSSRQISTSRNVPEELPTKDTPETSRNEKCDEAATPDYSDNEFAASVVSEQPVSEPRQRDIDISCIAESVNSSMHSIQITPAKPSKPPEIPRLAIKNLPKHPPESFCASVPTQKPVQIKRNTKPRMNQGEDLNKYRISIDLRSIRDLQTAYCVQLKYIHPMFGNTPFRTNPPVVANKTVETRLSNGFCAYELNLSPAELSSQLKDNPVIVQVIHTDRFKENAEIGLAWVDLWNLITSPPQDDGVRVQDQYIPIIDLAEVGDENKANQVGALRVLTLLEELETDLIAASELTNSDKEREVDRDCMEKMYQTAWELEAWKKKEQEEWRRKLKEKEEHRIVDLEKKWKTEEKNRSDLFGKRQKNLTKLEANLRNSLFDIEQQEKNLKWEESLLKKKELEVEEKYNKKQASLKAAVERLRTGYKHEEACLKRRITELERQNELLTSKLEQGDHREEGLREDLSRVRRKSEESTNGQLRMEIQRLTRELEHADSKRREEVKDNASLREKLFKTTQEITRLREVIHEMKEHEVEAERRRVEELRALTLARNQSHALRSDCNELTDIKHQLRNLMMQSTTISTEESKTLEEDPKLPCQ